MGRPVIQRSFAGGELAPILHARADQAKYLSGLRTCRNFLVRREGGVTSRPGLRFTSALKDFAAGHRLMRYVNETIGSSVLIEIGGGYLRFFRNGGAVTVAGVPAYNGATTYVPGDMVVAAAVNYYCLVNSTGNAPPNAAFWYPLTGAIYEIPTPYALADKFKWQQSGNVITITHPSYAPRELVFSTLTRWVLRTITTAPTIGPPTGGLGTPGAFGALTYRYVITAAAADSFEESNPSAPIVIAAMAKPTETAPVSLTWSAPVGAVPAEYYVYLDPYGNGVYGFIGTASTNAFKDAGLIPDFDVTPPIARVLFAAANAYPGTAAYFQQRRWFGYTNSEPDGIFGSRIGFTSNYGISSPLQDDDAVTFRIAGNNNNAVRYMLALKAGLVLMTDGGEWTVTGGGGPKTPITPNSIDADQETYVGVAAEVRPVIVGSAVLYVQARGKVVRALEFAQQVEGLAGKDLTIWATHLLEKRTITAIDYQQVPDSIIWCVRSDGVLLGLTYVPDQDVWGWHRHDSAAGAVFEDVCVVPETENDSLYVIVRRTINGATVRYIEKLESREISSFDADAFCVDSGLSYSGAAASTFGGLTHLVGQVVAVVADGEVVFNGDASSAQAATFTVPASGSLAIGRIATNVHIGLPIKYPEIETLDLDVQGSDVRDRRKAVHGVTLLVERSSRSFFAGPDAGHLRQFVRQAHELAADETTGQLEINVTASFDNYGRVFIRQVDPLPLTILGIIPNAEVGG